MANNSPLVIGIDSSTSSCKAIVWDTEGKAVAKGDSPIALRIPQPGWHEQDAESWWIAMSCALRQAVAGIDSHRLAALCIAHQRESFVSVDENDVPVSPGILWMDERASGILPALEELMAGENFHAITGKRLSVNLTIAKIAWLKKFEPGIFERTCKYLDVHAFLVHKLTGLYVTGWGCADPTGLFDMKNNRWARDILNKIGVREDQLPEAVRTGDAIGRVTRVAADACGIPEGLPVVAGIGDGQSSGLGTNITKPGDAYLSLGTSVVSGIYSDAYVSDSAFRTMYAGIPGAFMLETVLLGGGYTIGWFMEKLAREESRNPDAIRRYEEAARQVNPGSDGLVVVPYWNSVLGPYWDPLASGMIIGLRGAHGLSHIYRAILEGIAFEQRLCTLDAEKALSRNIDRYIAIGSGAASDLWCGIIADITGKPVYRSVTHDATSLGAGILAAVGAGLFPDARTAATRMTRIIPEAFEPDTARHAFYTRVFDEVYRPLFPSVRQCMDRLGAITIEGYRK